MFGEQSPFPRGRFPGSRALEHCLLRSERSHWPIGFRSLSLFFVANAIFSAYYQVHKGPPVSVDVGIAHQDGVKVPSVLVAEPSLVSRLPWAILVQSELPARDR